MRQFKRLLPVRPLNLTAAMALCVSTAGCLSNASGPEAVSDEELKALYAQDEAMLDNDTYLAFNDAEAPTAAPDTVEFDYIYFYGNKATINKDYFPQQEMDWIFFPVALLKMPIWLVDSVADWFKSSDYAAFTFTNTTDEPMNISADTILGPLNWRLARGKASVRLCDVNSEGGDEDCSNLGSIKRGNGTSKKVEVPVIQTNSDYTYTTRVPAKMYYRTYGFTVAPGETKRVYLKHKLQCTVVAGDIGLANQGDDTCIEDPFVGISFTKIN